MITIDNFPALLAEYSKLKVALDNYESHAEVEMERVLLRCLKPGLSLSWIGEYSEPIHFDLIHYSHPWHITFFWETYVLQTNARYSCVDLFAMLGLWLIGDRSDFISHLSQGDDLFELYDVYAQFLIPYWPPETIALNRDGIKTASFNEDLSSYTPIIPTVISQKEIDVVFSNDVKRIPRGHGYCGRKGRAS